MIAKSQLAFIDSYVFPTLDPPFDSLPKPYFTLAATIINVWRSVGMSQKLKAAAEGLGLPPAVKNGFGVMPGRFLRGRWNACASGEKVILEVLLYIGIVFARAIPEPKKRGGGGGGAGAGQEPGADEAQDWKESWKQYKGVARKAAGNKLQLAKTLISYAMKGPITHFMLSAQKRVKEYNKLCEAATKEGRVYLGPTPMSAFVCGWASDVAAEYEALLDPAEWEAGGKWHPLYEIMGPDCPEDIWQSIRVLIISVVYIGAASWEQRMMKKVLGWPLMLLRMVQADAHEDCDDRQAVACKMLELPNECCLDTPTAT